LVEGGDGEGCVEILSLRKAEYDARDMGRTRSISMEKARESRLASTVINSIYITATGVTKSQSFAEEQKDIEVYASHGYFIYQRFGR